MYSSFLTCLLYVLKRLPILGIVFHQIGLTTTFCCKDAKEITQIPSHVWNFTCIWLISMVNVDVGKNTMHGSYGMQRTSTNIESPNVAHVASVTCQLWEETTFDSMQQTWEPPQGLHVWNICLPEWLKHFSDQCRQIFRTRSPQKEGQNCGNYLFLSCLFWLPCLGGCL